MKYIFYILLLTYSVFSNEMLFNESSMGQKNISEYFGPTFPKIKHNVNSGIIEFNELEANGSYTDSIYFGNLTNLESFFNNHLSPSLQCPNYYLDQNINYIRYIYRLLTISYLYEAVNNYQVNLKLLDSQKRCNVDWSKILKACNSKTPDMKKFISNALKVNKFFKLDSKMSSHSNFSKDWYKDFYEINESTIAHTRAFSYCEHHNIDCLKLKKNEIVEVLNKTCSEDLEAIQNICSETDDLYGLSSIPEAMELLVQSNVKNNFNLDGKAKGCLVRFSQIMSVKEKIYYPLFDLFSVVNEQLRNNLSTNYIQGKLFVQGSFKEFELKGLDSIYEEDIVKAVTDEKVIAPGPETKPEIVVKDAKIVIQVKPKEIIKVEEPKVNTPIVKINKTAFLEAAELLEAYNLDKVKVDMNKFKYDYVFTFSVLKKLQQSLKNYVTQNALTEMKEMDKLGLVNAPVPLIFIKYLIDTDNHQGLFNMINILGDRFFVINTIDVPIKYPSNLIELKNDSSTGNKWQITIFDEAKFKK